MHVSIDLQKLEPAPVRARSGCSLQGDSSKFAPYVNSLPQSYDCLLAWTDEERALLEGTGRFEVPGAAMPCQLPPLLRRKYCLWLPGRVSFVSLAITAQPFLTLGSFGSAAGTSGVARRSCVEVMRAMQWWTMSAGSAVCLQI